MSGKTPFHEDLPGIAADNFEIATRSCRSCGEMHALWPYIRLARVSMGAPSSPLDTVLARLIAEGRRSVLIAGSSDTGLLGLVARAGGGAELDIVVLDRCPTPLESCRRLARRWSLPISTLHQDLTELDLRDRFDIVLAHGTLRFISSDRLTDVLARLRRALRPAGLFLLHVKNGRRIAGDLASRTREDYADWVIAELERLGISLPEEQGAFAARLRVHAENRERREGGFSTIEEVNALLTAAGFSVCQSLEIRVKLSDRMQQVATQLSQRRYILIAEASHLPSR